MEQTRESPAADTAAPARPWAARLRAARWLWAPLAAFGISRLVVLAVAYLAAPLLVDAPSPPPYHMFGLDNTLLDVFASRWDTGFYLSIASEGYRYRGVELPSVAFWPLLPLLMRALSGLLGGPAAAGLLIANGALLGAAILLHRLVDDEWGEAVADRATWYMLIFPSSLFGSAIYSDSLFLLCAVAALLLARRGLWESAALVAFAAGLSRFVGLVVAPMLLLEWWRQRSGGAARRPPPLAALACLGAPLGTAAYMAYLQVGFGDPLAFLHASEAWARQPSSPAALVADLLRPPAEGWPAALLAGRLPLDNWIDALFVLAFIGLGAALVAERRWPEAALLLPGVLIPLSSGLLMSQRRYMWVLFPAYILLARWGERPWVDRLITAVSLAGLALFTALFANWYWVG